MIHYWEDIILYPMRLDFHFHHFSLICHLDLSTFHSMLVVTVVLHGADDTHSIQFRAPDHVIQWTNFSH